MGIAERKDRQKQAMRERILDASRRIVMREGFAALSMRKIADAIEYSPATLYLHFASRDEIAQALCAEGYAQLLALFVPLAQITDPAERLKALGRAYVGFGVAHPQTYQLIFMEDPSYTGAALGGHATGAAAAPAPAPADAAAKAGGDTSSGNDAARVAAARAQHESGDASLLLMTGALEELKASGRLPASADVMVWAEAFWATLHGIVALNLTCPVFPMTSLDTVVDVALNAWFGAPSPAVGADHAQPATAATSATTATTAPTAKPARARKPSPRPKPQGA